jgi:DNA-binding MarR family transcriptional regulator
MHYTRMNTTDINSQTETTVLRFLETAAILERRLDRALSNTRGISFSEYRLLSTLSKAKTGGIPRIDLANAVGLTASAVTRALKPLEKLGYVTTQRSERDARQSLAIITPAGLELLNDAQGVLQDILRELPLNTLSQQKITEFQNRLKELKDK